MYHIFQNVFGRSIRFDSIRSIKYFDLDLFSYSKFLSTVVQMALKDILVVGEGRDINAIIYLFI